MKLWLSSGLRQNGGIGMAKVLDPTRRVARPRSNAALLALPLVELAQSWAMPHSQGRARHGIAKQPVVADTASGCQSARHVAACTQMCTQRLQQLGAFIM